MAMCELDELILIISLEDDGYDLDCYMSRSGFNNDEREMIWKDYDLLSYEYGLFLNSIS
tara:strand:+ start:78 stop:254 length:177 start_codon:yes stop_codon:yes gene_type:complete